MIKKTVVATIVFTILGTSNILSYASPITNQLMDTRSPRDTRRDRERKVEVVKQSFQIAIPEKDMVTSDKNLVLSFKAPEGTKVSIEVYHNASKDDKEENYILSYDPIEVTIGEMQLGWAEVELKTGLNKIQFTAEYKNGLKDSDVRIVNVMDIEEVKKLLDNIVNKSTLGIGRRRP